MITGRRLNLQNPQAFTEKIQWLKLYWHEDILALCADKYQVRRFVEERIGPGVLKEIYGVYEKPEHIDLNSLPDAFVLKVNHGCKQNIFCRQKSGFDWYHATQLLKKYLKNNLYPEYLEWSYKNIVPRILCEEYLAKDGESLHEFGFYCYDGVPCFVEINEYRNGMHRVSMFDLDLNLLENKYGSPPFPQPITRFQNFDTMVGYSRALSEGFPFVRVDLLYLNGNIYFGEMTFYPLAGMAKISPQSFDYFLGSYLHLPEPTKNNTRQQTRSRF